MEQMAIISLNFEEKLSYFPHCYSTFDFLQAITKCPKFDDAKTIIIQWKVSMKRFTYRYIILNLLKKRENPEKFKEKTIQYIQGNYTMFDCHLLERILTS
jgi:hypothetical protein